jgi:hypothetical protein
MATVPHQPGDRTRSSAPCGQSHSAQALYAEANDLAADPDADPREVMRRRDDGFVADAYKRLDDPVLRRYRRLARSWPEPDESAEAG